MSIAAPRSYGAVVKPCIECGEPSTESRCDEHQLQPWRHHEGIARARGYDAAWDKLSRRARRLQPFCIDCYTTENLSTDHKPSAWKRKAEGKPIRLRDVDVVCLSCNVKRGTSRPQGTRSEVDRSGPTGEAKSPLHTALARIHR
jgi:5-methylcytosine-specific restriction enzyme A